MPRKIAILGFTVLALTGLTLADDESPLEKLMEQVQNKTNAIRKITRNAAEYKKGAASIPKDAEVLIKLAKQAREDKGPSEKEKKPFAEWQKLMDAMIQETEELSKVAANPKSTQEQAKTAFTTFTKTCGACHNVFKKED